MMPGIKCHKAPFTTASNIQDSLKTMTVYIRKKQQKICLLFNLIKMTLLYLGGWGIDNTLLRRTYRCKHRTEYTANKQQKSDEQDEVEKESI